MVSKSATSAALPLYVMLGLTAALFGVQLALSHVTHALTLLVDSYHMLCNLIALTGCIITIKVSTASWQRCERRCERPRSPA